jgi:outer membrane protein OmpA-like peptidoglycan-associated protein
MSTIRFTFFIIFLLLAGAPLIAQQQMKATRSQVIPWGSPVSNIYIDFDNNRWVAHKKGLSKVFGLNLAAEVNVDAGQTSLASLKGGNANIVWNDNALKALIGDVTLKSGIYDELREEIWLGTEASGLFCIKTKPTLQLVEEMTSSNSKLKSNTINDFTIDTRNRLWVATDDGILMRESGKWILIEKGLRIEAVANHEDDIWLMGDDLVGKLNRKNIWIITDIPSGKVEGTIKDIDVDAKGQLWMASGIITVYNPDDDSFSIFGPAQEYTSQFATCIAIDNTGIPWVGTRDKGVYFIQEGAVFAVLCEIVSQADCSGDGTAELIVKVEGASAPLQYNWSGGLQGKNPKSAPPGTYEVTVTDASGASSEASITIPDNSITLNIQQDAQADNGQSNGQATVLVEGGKPAYTYVWDNGETTASAQNLSPGKHKVTVTDSENCTSVAEVTISEGLEKLTLQIIASSEISCDGKTGATVEIAAQGGQPPYSYNWDKSGLDGAKVSGLFAGNYNLTATDAQGNEASLLVNINARDMMELSASQVGAASVGGSDGQANVQVTKGIAPYTYKWDNGEQSPLARKLSPGNHKVTVTDAKGCTATASVSIDEDILPLELSLETTKQPNCNDSADGSIQANVRGGKAPYIYKWSGTEATTATATQLAANKYALEVTDVEGTSQKAEIELSAPPALELTVSQNSPASTNGSDGVAVVQPNGGTAPYTYQWDNGESTAEASRLTPGEHTVSVTDANGCSTNVTVDITEDILPLKVSLEAITEISCFGAADGTLEAKVNGGKQPYTYKWSKTNATAAVATQLAANQYELEVTDVEGTSQKASFELKAPTALELTVSQVSPASINGSDGVARVEPNGGTAPYTYQWDNGESTAEASKLTPGEHTVSVTDANGCSTNVSVDITEDILPLKVSLEAITEISCFGAADGALEAKVNGGKAPYTYRWSGTEATTATASQLAANKYELEVTDVEGTSQKASFELSAPAALELTVSQTSPASTNGSDGVAVVQPNGGTAPYTYQWDNGESTAEASKLTPGEHTVSVTDANGCSTNVSVDITEDILPLKVSLEAITEISCFGAADGALEAKVNGGKAPYTYRWSGTEATTATASQLAANKYELEVTDVEGTSQKASFELSAPAALELTVSQTSPASTGNSDGIAVVAIKGGTAPYSIEWDNGMTTNEAKQLAPGNHSVTVTDANSCSTTQSINISEDILPLQLALAITKEISCSDVADGQITASITGGKPPYQYSWTGTEATTEVASQLSANEYTLEVTDAADQKQTAKLSIEAPKPLIATASVRSPASTNNSDGVALVEVQGGRAPYTYSWSGGATTEIAEGLSPGIQTVTVSDASGCQSSSQVEVTENILPLKLVVKEQNPVRCHEEQNGSLIAEVSGGKAPYYYNWSHNSLNSAEATDLGAGTYSLTVTDVSDTEQVVSFDLAEPDKLTISATVLASASTNQSDGKARVEVSGGTGAYTYRWKDGNTSPEADNLAPGMHTVVVTDERNCETSVTFEVTEDILPLEVALTLSQALTCADVNNAALEAAVSGGKSPYEYQWNPSTLSGEGAYDLGPGEYQLTVTDILGTEKSVSYSIPALTPVTAEITKVVPALTATSEDGQATVVASGGTPPYSFIWDSGANAAKAENLAVGMHTVTITDNNGCTAETEVEVIERIMKELASGTLKSGSVVNIEKLQFDADSIVIREDAIPIINEVYQFLEDNPSIVVEIGGHTNNLPPPAYCDSLSTNRARVVAEYIVNKGIASNRVYYKGYGKRKPKFSNGTADGRRRNQRVEIKILKI